jgi:hypothetical protein
MKLLVFTTFLIIFFLASCNEKESLTENTDSQVESLSALKDKDEALAQFRNELLVLLQNQDFRSLLKDEIGKKFDSQYDIIYDFIKEKEIIASSLKSSSTTNKLSVRSFFSKELKIEDKSLFKRPIQISIPVHFEDWDPLKSIPPVVILPADFNEDAYDEVEAICEDGSIIKLSTNVAPDFPVILICEAERVDEDMNLTVDNNGILQPKEKRIKAFDAYLNADKHLKSARIEADPFIIIYEDTLPIVTHNNEKSVNAIQFIGAGDYQYSFEQLIENNSIIQAPADNDIRLTYSAANRIELDWPSIPNANGYYVAYMSNIDSNWKYKFFPNAKAIFANLDETEEYSFQIHTVRGQYCSDNSVTQSKIVSGRNKNQAEYIDKIYISKAYFRSIEFWGYQHVELDIKGTRALEDLTTSEITDCRSYYVVSDDNVQGKTYHNHHFIFYWDVDAIGQSYSLTFVEDDGSGTADDIIASVDLITKAFLPSQYKTVWDKTFGTFQKIYEIAAKDEKIGTLQIKWHQPNSQVCEIHGSSFVVTMDHDKSGILF